MSVNTDGLTCGICGLVHWTGTIHRCGVMGPGAPTTGVWNVPICRVCGQHYLDPHDCDLEPIPCPDGRDDCTVAHYGHKKR